MTIDINALIASAIPVQPPDEWFENPYLAAPTPIKVLPNGRVYGHVASWDTDHIGLPYATKPPKSKTNYAYFKTGEIMTASGSLVPVGQLTLAGGHAGLEATAAQAARHYDDTKSAIADVTVGEDPHGIWVSGAVRSNASPEQVRALRASAPSGDWRLINGRLEMVAVCQVNVPGFPIPRALAAGGQRVALVAAGSAGLVAMVAEEQALEMRLQRLEAIAEEKEQEQLALVASAAKERVDRLRQERLQREAELARQRVRDPKRQKAATTLTAAARQEAARRNLAASAQKLVTGDLHIGSYTAVQRAVAASKLLSDDEAYAVRETIVASAIELGAFSALPEEWHEAALVAAGVSAGDESNPFSQDALAAAGNFKHLDDDFLSSKAEEQPRDNNGRFVQTGAFLRWKTSGKEGYEFGQVIGRKVNPDGTMDVRLADSNAVVKKKPNELEVIRAILPVDQVDNEDDRGIPFKKKDGKKTPASPSAPNGFKPSTDPVEVEAPSVADVVPGETESPIAVGTRVAVKGTAEDLGTVTKADDPLAVEVTDDGGLVTVHEAIELEVLPAAPAAPVAAPAAGPAI